MIEKYYNVLDNKTNLDCYNHFMHSKGWSYTAKSVENAANKRFWYYDLMDDIRFTIYFFNHLQWITNKKFKLKKVYANGQTSGQCSCLHKDGLMDKDYTFLYYVNPSWNSEWGGGTVFCDESGNQINYNFFEPNSAILFKSNIMHVGLEPTSLFESMRITVAFKLELIEGN